MRRQRGLIVGMMAAVFCLVGSAVGLGQEPTVEEGPGASSMQMAQVAPLLVPQEPALISLDFVDADVRAVLQALGSKGGVNIVTSAEVAGVVTIHLEDVTWEQALDTIVKTYGLGYEKDGNIIMVTTLADLKVRREAIAELTAVESLTTRVIQLQFLDATDVRAFLEPQLTAQGRISVLEVTGQKGWSFGGVEAGESGSSEERYRTERENSRSKAVVITDTPSTIDRLEKVLAKIDVMPKQILIESKVIEVNRDLLRDLGVEFGTGTGSTTLSTTQGFVSGTNSRTFGQQELNTDPGQFARSSVGGSALNQFLTPSIFIPETTGLTAANTGLSLVFQKLRGTQFEVLLRALEEDVRTNTLSAPHVLTLSGQEAKILVGSKYPILETQVSGDTSTTTTTSLSYYQDIGIELYVVPTVSGDRHIDMIVHPVVSSFTTTVGDNAYPILDIREAETQIIMENGDTVVIGGLLKDVKAKSRVGLPFLGKLPLLGPIFSRSTTDVEKVDLLIFITARVIEPGLLSSEEASRLQERYEAFLRENLSNRSGKKTPSKRTAPVLGSTSTSGNRGVLN